MYAGLSNVDVGLRVYLSLSRCVFCRRSCLCVVDGQAPAIGKEKAIYGACSGPTEPDESIPITGVWTFGVSAGPACVTTLPFGYGTAPRGGGQATLTQSGNRFSGELLIFGVPSGSIDGTLQGNNVVEASLRLDGTNQGVLKPGDAPCRVVARGTGHVSRRSGPGTKPTICHIKLNLVGDFACPYSCPSSSHTSLLERSCG